MKAQITKKEWIKLGGLRNPRCSRKHDGTKWLYYYEVNTFILQGANHDK